MDISIIILIIAMIFAVYAQAKVGTTYRKYTNVQNSKGITGGQAARTILDKNGLNNVPIEVVAGKMSDHYDPRTRVMRLSGDVYNGATISAVSIAAHEAGHAVQHATGYSPLKIRNSIAPVVNIASNLAWPILILGIFLQISGLFTLGILMFSAAVFFQAITLPVEFNASKIAVEMLDNYGIIDESEKGGAKRMLSAAAMTYLAAMAMSLANLLRLIMLNNRR
jgi:Zn-dependent membrane protease YugP